MKYIKFPAYCISLRMRHSSDVIFFVKMDCYKEFGTEQEM